MIKVPQVLTIAGIDSSGGAGANADIKTFHNQCVYAATIITGLTAQNTYGVQSIDPVAPKFILDQFDSVFNDLEISATKTGALFGKEQVDAVVQGIKKYQIKNLVVDPVMVAKGGAKLLSDEAVYSVKTQLFPMAQLITPNLEEAEVLVGYAIDSEINLINALHDLQSLGAKNVLIKGEHSSGDRVNDVLLTSTGEVITYRGTRINTNHTHGTGDTLSSYIVAHLAQGEEFTYIMPKAKEFINRAIGETIDIGHGHGPLNHWVKS
ncbi:bifunctional hydroxymethylpyrimidine kinase/phosphomethylpyrimidine kinase [Lactovum miscens]|uniref:Hydroxymethylpyrimidine/phosphomethylpyrimidine kinase n=1 Tax=Lactovum miscens TaxID=190387 RepID=A0A841C7I1_9LACT|nr:bifunctional hydroxymethylpyrimidine kinase/phosphomethylpyrimidine kinase [Lactovum miscens]MBB5888753.1 hydroxymethylpyrimidine/phosphomethylpyrimidine kinase [Lactovum miscens]